MGGAKLCPPIVRGAPVSPGEQFRGRVSSLIKMAALMVNHMAKARDLISLNLKSRIQCSQRLH